MFADLVRTLHDVFFEEYGKYQLQKWQLISETQRSPGYSTLSHPSSFFFFFLLIIVFCFLQLLLRHLCGHTSTVFFYFLGGLHLTIASLPFPL